MKTTVIESGKNNTEVKNNSNPVTTENKNPQFVAGNQVNKDSVKPQTEPAKTDTQQQPQAVQSKPAETPTNVAPAAAPKPEPVKPVRNLEETIKFLETLHDLKIKRDKYLATLSNLDEFEIDLKKENEDFDNFYTGCTLTITDDAGRKFTTKNPAIIYPVSQQITSICAGKLAEVEAGLVITA